MLENEIIETFKNRELNCKTNNFIFSKIDNFEIIDKIPDKCNISLPENNIDIEFAHNIKIDLDEIDVKDILSYTLEFLKKSALVDTYFDYTLDFNTKFDLIKFQTVLYNYDIISQLIFYNMENLSLKEQKLFNELYFFNSIFFNSNSFIMGDNFKTYFLGNGKSLDNRENYTKIKTLKN